MSVSFYSLPDMMEELKEEGCHLVRVHSWDYRKNVPFTDGKATIHIPHQVFEVIVTARVRGEVYEYINRQMVKIDKKEEFRKRFEQIREGIIRTLKENKFFVKRGVYEESH